MNRRLDIKDGILVLGAAFSGRSNVLQGEFRHFRLMRRAKKCRTEQGQEAYAWTAMQSRMGFLDRRTYKIIMRADPRAN
jgi:hypothetical protein